MALTIIIPKRDKFLSNPPSADMISRIPRGFLEWYLPIDVVSVFDHFLFPVHAVCIEDIPELPSHTLAKLDPRVLGLDIILLNRSLGVHRSVQVDVVVFQPVVSVEHGLAFVLSSCKLLSNIVDPKDSMIVKKLIDFLLCLANDSRDMVNAIRVICPRINDAHWVTEVIELVFTLVNLNVESLYFFIELLGVTLDLKGIIFIFKHTVLVHSHLLVKCCD